MPVLKPFKVPNTWETICQDFEKRRSLVDSTKSPTTATKETADFDAAKHSPVFYGYSFAACKVDDDRLLAFDPAVSHPACVGFTIEPYREEKSQSPASKTAATVAVKGRKTGTTTGGRVSEREYLEAYVFPTLLPALEKMLEEAKRNKCFERKRTAFNACDFLTEYLYKNNPFKLDDESVQRSQTDFWEIPFVHNWLLTNPRPPLPKSLVWTELEACLKIQAFYRGYLVRREPEVQELRQWQRELREENQSIVSRVDKFWTETAEEALAVAAAKSQDLSKAKNPLARSITKQHA